MDARCEEGYYVGRATNAPESYILTLTGVVKCRTFWRRPVGERWTPDLYACFATVLQPNGLDPDSTTIGVRAPVLLPDQGDAQADNTTDQARKSRRLQLSRSYFERPNIHWVHAGVPSM